MAMNEIGDGIKSKVESWHLKRKLFWLLTIIVLGFASYAAFIMYYPYSDGTRTGHLRKLSHKGYVFKTWEGELQMSALLSPADASGAVAGGNVWLFSVKDDNVIKNLQEAERMGKKVTLHYREYLKQLSWRGETKYFVDGVTIQE